MDRQHIDVIGAYASRWRRLVLIATLDDTDGLELVFRTNAKQDVARFDLL